VVDNGTRLTNKRILITAEPEGTPDGFRVDMDGNLWCGWGMGHVDLDGVKVFNPEGKPIGQCLLRWPQAQSACSWLQAIRYMRSM
jgi:gluconolactonase